MHFTTPYETGALRPGRTKRRLFGCAVLVFVFLPAWLGAAPTIRFGPLAIYTNNNRVDNICTGDFNGDQHLDLATVTFNYAGAPELILWTNNGYGGFAVRTNYPAAGTPVIIKAGDLNNDGSLDLLTANYTGDSLSAFLGNGDGTFNRVDTSVLVNDSMPGLALGDFNGDGKLDAALATYGIKILLGNGNGAFTLFTNYSASTMYAVAAADLNGDHKLDLVTANYSYSSMSVYLGNGDGTFAAPTNYSGDFSEYHYAVAVGDFNNDSKPDLATINQYDNSVSVRLNNGDGTFGPDTRIKLAVVPGPVVVGDFNHDDHLDLVVGGKMLPGNGDGTFGEVLITYTGIYAPMATECLVAGDFDGDGLVDFATTRAADNAVSVRLNQSVAWLQITPLTGAIKLSWPNWPGYQLERSTDLSNTNWWAWMPVLDGPVLVGNQKVFTNSTAADRRFFRLKLLP